MYLVRKAVKVFIFVGLSHTSTTLQQMIVTACTVGQNSRFAIYRRQQPCLCFRELSHWMLFLPPSLCHESYKKEPHSFNMNLRSLILPLIIFIPITFNIELCRASPQRGVGQLFIRWAAVQAGHQKALQSGLLSRTSLRAGAPLQRAAVPFRARTGRTGWISETHRDSGENLVPES